MKPLEFPLLPFLSLKYMENYVINTNEKLHYLFFETEKYIKDNINELNIIKDLPTLSPSANENINNEHIENNQNTNSSPFKFSTLELDNE